MKSIKHESQYKDPNRIPTKEQVLSKALIKVATNLDLTQSTLSEIIGISKAEMSRLFNAKVFLFPHTKEGECALLLIRAYRSLNALLGEDERQCKEWFQSYNIHLQDKPKELCKTIMGLAEIVVYLDAMRGIA